MVTPNFFELLGVRADLGRLFVSTDTAAVPLAVALAGYLGAACGLCTAWAASRLLARFLFEVQPTEPLAYALAAILVLGIAALACLLPARRAVRLPAMLILKGE